MIGDIFIPGNTKVLAPRWVIFRLESCFERALEFIPERWYSKPEMVKNRDAFSPFGMGRASCVGQGLALTQIRLVAASLVKKFEIKFLPGEDGHEVLRDMRDQITSQPGQLRLRFKARK
jgi:cytochrome P450